MFLLFACRHRAAVAVKITNVNLFLYEIQIIKRQLIVDVSEPAFWGREIDGPTIQGALEARVRSPYYTFGVAGQSDESLICPSILMQLSTPPF
jgi:hypothetical protein